MAIRLIIQGEWDPASVDGEPYAEQDYKMYVPGIHHLLRHNRPEAWVISYLRRVEEQYIR